MVTCLVCDRDESVLVCKVEECGFAIHVKCLPCLAYFDASGSFYCPECSYDLVVKECVKVKKSVRLARQELVKFIRAGKCSSNVQFVEIEATRKEISSGLEGDGCDVAEAGGVCDKEDAVIPVRMDSPIKIIERGVVNESSSGDDLLVREEANADNGVASGVEKENLVTVSPNKLIERCIVNARSTGDDCLVRETTKADNGETDEGLEEIQQVSEKRQIPVSSGVMEECHVADTRGVNESANISQKRITDEIVEEGIEKDELIVENSDISEPDVGGDINKIPEVKAKRTGKERRAKSAHIGNSVSDSKNGEADESFKQRKEVDIATSSLKRKSSNTDNHGRTARPIKTRPRKQWSEKEVEILMEGVRKFSAPNTQMPWNRILQFGSRVFEPHRTAVDLKDKWRNLSK